VIHSAIQFFIVVSQWSTYIPKKLNWLTTWVT